MKEIGAQALNVVTVHLTHSKLYENININHFT